MDIGALYRPDNPKQTLDEQIIEAAAHYFAKYGQVANTCYVHPGALGPDGAPQRIGLVRVKALRTVIKGHLWLGVETDQ